MGLAMLMKLMQWEYTNKPKRGRKAKPKPILISKRAELFYTKSLIEIATMAHDETVNILIPEIKLAINSKVGDSAIRYIGDGLFDKFKNLFAILRQSVTSKVANIAKKLAEIVVKQQKVFTDNQLVKTIQSVVGIDTSFLMTDQAIAEAVNEAIEINTALINSIPSQYLDKAENIISTGLQSGRLDDYIIAEIEKLGGLTKERARIIAGDQIGKINCRLNMERQLSLGVTHYIWETKHDERVRGNPYGRYPNSSSSHYHRQSKVFAWSNPPKDGHPGFPIRCRCVAIPYLEHLIGGRDPSDIVKEYDGLQDLV